MKIYNQALNIVFALFSLTVFAGKEAAAKDYFALNNSNSSTEQRITPSEANSFLVANVENDAYSPNNDNKSAVSEQYYISSPLDLIKKERAEEKRRAKALKAQAKVAQKSQAQKSDSKRKLANASSNITFVEPETSIKAKTEPKKEVANNDLAVNPFDFTVPDYSSNDKNKNLAVNSASMHAIAPKAEQNLPKPIVFSRNTTEDKKVQVASIDKNAGAKAIQPNRAEQGVSYVSEADMYRELGMTEMAGNTAVRGQDNAEYQKIGSPYQVKGKWYIPSHEPDYDEKGVASWYGSDFNGKKTANDEVFDMEAITVAHPTLPMPSLVEVTNLDNGRTVIARVNDRGPFASSRLIDVSKRAAELLGFKEKGTANVRVRYVGIAPSIDDSIKNNKVMLAENKQNSVQQSIAKVKSSEVKVAEVAQKAVKKEEAKVYASADSPAVSVKAQVSNSVATKAVNFKRPAASVKPATAEKIIVAQAQVQTKVKASAAKAVNFVQVGAFSSRANAERFAESKKQAGEVKIAEISTEKGVLYRVLLAA